MKPSAYPMVTIEEALATILEQTPLLPAEVVSLREAVGRVLAEDVHAAENMPPFAASSVDGYAVAAREGTASRRVVSEIIAGHGENTRLKPGCAVRIMTGAPVPQGADAVAMVEDTAEDEGWLTLNRAMRAGDNVIPIGLDVATGQLALARGTLIGYAEVALLATVGKCTPAVHRAPSVAVLSTGDELVEPDAPLAPGKIRDSNRYGLMAAVAQAHGRPVSLGTARDDMATQEAMIRAALAEADVVLTSGGVSVGSRDLIKPIVERLGRVHFGRIAMKPGKPLTFATVGKKLFFGLPGFPVSSLVTFELFVRPALLRMQGLDEVSRPAISAILEHPIKRTPERTEFQRAIVRHADGRLFARATGLQASSRVLSLVGANALLRIPPGSGQRAEVIDAGEMVTALLVGPIQ